MKTKAKSNIKYVCLQTGRYIYQRSIKGTLFRVYLRTDDPRIAAKLSRGITSILETMAPSSATVAQSLAKAYLDSPKGSSKPARRSFPVSLKIKVAKEYLAGRSPTAIAKEYDVDEGSPLYWATQHLANHFTLDNAVAFSRNPVVLRSHSKC